MCTCLQTKVVLERTVSQLLTWFGNETEVHQTEMHSKPKLKVSTMYHKTEVAATMVASPYV